MFVKTLRLKKMKGRIGESFNLSYHVIDSDCKLQSYNSKYSILSHNVLICLSKLLDQQDKM